MFWPIVLTIACYILDVIVSIPISNKTDTTVLLNPNGYNHTLPPPSLRPNIPMSLNIQQEMGRSFFVDGLGRRGDRKPMSNMINKMFNVKRIAFEIENSLMSSVTCTACIGGTTLLQHYIRSGKSDAEIKHIVYKFCTSLKIQTERVCAGVTANFAGEVIEVLKNIDLGPKEVCSFVIGDGCDDVYNPQHEWQVVLPPIQKMAYTSSRIPDPPNGNFFKVLHVSDTHFDPYYMEGSWAGCNEPLCCRLTNGVARNPLNAAGKWGDYRKCDTPKRTIDHMFNHIADTHKDIDYIIWTGDLPAHDIWNQTREENLDIIKKTVLQMLQKFPGVPIFPALGNHESVPVNSFPLVSMKNISKNSISWLYDDLAKHWSNWLPQSTQKTIKSAAYYSALVRPGFRIISINMNFCNNKNWWLLINSTDPEMELQWLINELQAAEFNEEKVHIIGHIPPGHSDCLKVWSRNYYLIINRYESTVTAQFFGHTHYDEFELFYDIYNQSRPINVAYIGPSVTPYYDLNPGYRIYYVDGDHINSTRSVIDHETWVMNLEEANIYNTPLWYKLYSAREAFNMKALRPQDWSLLVDQMTADIELFDKFYNFYYKASPVAPVCDISCRKRILCDLRSGRSHDRKSLCTLSDGKVDTNVTWSQWALNKIFSALMSIPSLAMTIPNAIIGRII